MRSACFIAKATNTHSEYVIHIVFPQQLLHERASLSRYVHNACLVKCRQFLFYKIQGCVVFMCSKMEGCLILGSDCMYNISSRNRMFIGPCIIVIVEELKTNLMSLVVFISLIFAQHVSNINKSIFRSLRL